MVVLRGRSNEKKNPLSSDRLHRWDKKMDGFFEPGTHRSTHIKVKIETNSIEKNQK